MDSLDAAQPTLDAALLRRCLTLLKGDVAALCASACVSKAWNAAAQDQHVWHRLVVPRRLADELTDERFKELLGRSGGAVERLDVSRCGQLSAAAITDAIKSARASLTHLAVGFTRITAHRVLSALDGKRLTFLSVRGVDIYDESDADLVGDEPYNDTKTRLLAQLNACVADTAADATQPPSSSNSSWSSLVQWTRPFELCFYTVRKYAWEWDYMDEPRPPKVVCRYVKDPRFYDEEPLPEGDPPQAGLDVTSACGAMLLENHELAYGHGHWAMDGQSLEDAAGVCGRMCGGAAAAAAANDEVQCPQCRCWICSVCAPKLSECNVHGLMLCNSCMIVQDGCWCNNECFNQR